MSRLIKFYYKIIFYLLLANCSAFSAPFEEIELNKHTTIGVYFGSFDPIHVGHEDIIEQSLRSGLCDYVLIFAAPGVIHSKPDRTLWEIRNEMLAKIYENNPRVLVVKTSNFKDISAKLYSKECVIVSILGSDSALRLVETPSSILIEPKQWNIFLRDSDHYFIFKDLNFKMPFDAHINLLKSHIDISSTKIRNYIKMGVSLEQLPINPKIISVIKKYKLYGIHEEL